MTSTSGSSNHENHEYTSVLGPVAWLLTQLIHHHVVRPAVERSKARLLESEQPTLGQHAQHHALRAAGVLLESTEAVYTVEHLIGALIHIFASRAGVDLGPTHKELAIADLSPAETQSETDSTR